MKYGFIKVASSTNTLQVANPVDNVDDIVRRIVGAHNNGAKVIVFPELCLTGYTCGDLFWHNTLIEGTTNAILKLIKETAKYDIVITVGGPFSYKSDIFNCAFVIHKGNLLGIVPKTSIPNYGEFYEIRNFAKGKTQVKIIDFCGHQVPFGTNILFCCENVENLKFGVEICEDMWQMNQPAESHIANGATMIFNLSASNEVIGKKEYRKNLIKSCSGKGICGYIYSDAGNGESTTDLVFASHNIIAENGNILSQAKLFENQTIYAVIDVDKLVSERRKLNTFVENDDNYTKVNFKLKSETTNIEGIFSKHPFVPKDSCDLSQRCEEILNMQAYGLKKRLEHTNSKSAVLGISGGLDSTLALLVTARAFDLLKKDKKEIVAVTMPCFGTTDRTYNNAVKMIKYVGATFKEINIHDAVVQHFKDIEHDDNIKNVTYENSQARERTQILMDIANQQQGFVVGTGDMSELALGWATYNGDHMSMYGVNCSIPKTLIKFLVKYVADTTKDSLLKEVLYDITDTPVSPELLPPTEGEISQRTEDLVGPYELHDFFLYYFMRFNFQPSKIYHIALEAFKDGYDSETIKKWLIIFVKRFFSQQYKRSCLPDGPKVGTVSLSPRGDLRMPSDAVFKLWLDEI